MRLTTCADDVHQIRKTIITLAVRGQLVSQDPNDEPAQLLAERIAQDKQESPKHKGIRTPIDLSAVTADEVPFSLPRSWHWTRLGTVAQRVIDGNYGEKYPTKAEFVSEGIPFLTSAAIGTNGGILGSEVRYISENKHAELVKAQSTVGDILLTNRGARVGAAALLSDLRFKDCNIGPQLTSIRTGSRFIDHRYLFLYVQSPSFREIFNDTNAGTAMNFVNLSKTANMLVPLAPIAEQRRIVAKVEELFAICDQLEAHLNCAQDERGRLLLAVIHQALSGGMNPDAEHTLSPPLPN